MEKIQPDEEKKYNAIFVYIINSLRKNTEVPLKDIIRISDEFKNMMGKMGGKYILDDNNNFG